MPVEVTVATPDSVRRGAVAAGEAWLATARRLVPDAVVDPVALDLSGPLKRFVVDVDLRVAVRPMVRGDLPDVVRWRSAPHVHRWWAGDGPPTPAAVRERYLPAIEGDEPTWMWVWEVNGRSVGLVQDYRIADHPEYALLTPDPTAVGVDYLLGEADRVGRGLGTRCLWAWAVHARARYPDVGAFFAAPDHRNRASLRVLAKLGFVEGLWFDEPQEDGTVATVVGCTLDVGRVLGSDGDPP
ncbi:GNAT family N-acetyltransferase [Nocardioides dongxiaopingii]|uniref:GNAT family N-acetyltransferase n=1 Tax=Nocardioides dongxiaopingii TaxID=2576036 RepID=UPI0010C76D0E|nr:GNAT family N-acetyltransferase [Nocardioides dongxiaopingii]